MYKNINELEQLVSNIYNTSVVLEYFCKNQQEIEGLYNITPVVQNLVKNADLLNSFFINWSDKPLK